MEDYQKMMNERTLVLIKPDAIQRGLTGEIITRFERCGLKIVAAKFVMATREKLKGHFHATDEWLRGIGIKTTEGCRKDGVDVEDVMGTTDPLEIGKKIMNQLYDYLMSGPVMVMILQGIHAVNAVRKKVGYTIPSIAEPGTIRGDFSISSADLANVVGSPSRNLVHASSSVADAKLEIVNWFKDNEIVQWEKIDEGIMFVHGEYTQTKKGNQS